MKTPNLMLHCGASLVERPELSAVKLPEKTKTYHPVGHETFVGLVEDKLADVGFRFREEAHSLTHDGARYFGLAQLVNGGDNEEYSLVVGLRNSLDKRFPAAIAFGASVFVCDNLSFTGEITVARRHTRHIMRDLPGLVASAVSETRFMQENQDLRFECYRNKPLQTRRADHLIVEMLRSEVINTTRVQHVVREWDEPSHDHGPRTVWRLFNAVTEVLKGSGLEMLPARTIGLQSILDRAAGFTPRVFEGEAEVVETA